MSVKVYDSVQVIHSLRAVKRERLRNSTWDHLNFPEMVFGVPKAVSQNPVSPYQQLYRAFIFS